MAKCQVDSLPKSEGQNGPLKSRTSCPEGQLARSKSAESAALCPSDMMLCVISYWVLSGAKRRQIQQLRCCVLPGTQGSAGHERICSAPFGHRAGQVPQDHADHRHSFAGEAAEAGCPAERQGSGQGESTRFRSATAEPLAGRTGIKQTSGTTPHTGGALGNLNLIGSVRGRSWHFLPRHPVTRKWRCK